LIHTLILLKWETILYVSPGISIFFKCNSTSLFTCSSLYKNVLKFQHFYDYLIQYTLKSGGTNDHFKWVKVPGTTPYEKACKSTIQYVGGGFGSLTSCAVIHFGVQRFEVRCGCSFWF
jgi:hypothetical protein